MFGLCVRVDDAALKEGLLGNNHLLGDHSAEGKAGLSNSDEGKKFAPELLVKPWQHLFWSQQGKRTKNGQDHRQLLGIRIGVGVARIERRLQKLWSGDLEK